MDLKVHIRIMRTKTLLGEFIRKRRRVLGYSRTAFAKVCGLKHSLICNIEFGLRKYLQQDELMILSKALNCQVEDLTKLIPNKYLSKSGKQPVSKLGKLIREKRIQRRLSLAGLAQKVGTTRQYLNLIELKLRNLNLHNPIIKCLIQELNIDNDELVSCKEDKVQRKIRSVKHTTGIGSFFASRRIELGLTQGDVCSQTGFSDTTLSLIENGKYMIKEDHIHKLEVTLKCKLPDAY